jgi:hypothetical protein
MVAFAALLFDRPDSSGRVSAVKPRVSRTKPALFVMGIPPVVPGSGVTVLSINTLVSTSSITWRVTFSDPALDNVALVNISNYAFSPTLNIVSITPEAVANPTYVDIVTSEQVDSLLYTLTIHLVEKA